MRSYTFPQIPSPFSSLPRISTWLKNYNSKNTFSDQTYMKVLQILGRNKQANKVSLLVDSTVMQTTQLLFWKFFMSTQYIKIEQSEYNMIHTVCIYGSSVSLHFTTSSLARRYAFFRCDLLGSTTFIKIISSSSFDTISDSVMSGHSTSSMKLLTFPECSSL